MSLQYIITDEMDRKFDSFMIKNGANIAYLCMLTRSNLRAQECISAQLQKLVDALPEKGRMPWPP